MVNTLRDTVVGVVGAGTMGTGIAQVAAVAGHPVLLHDAVPGAAERAVSLVDSRVPDQLRLTATGSLADLAPAHIVVEAVVENLAVKRRLFADLEQVVNADCVLATNTSSLSPAALAAGMAYPERIVGLHFFNPVPLMRLVEVVAGPTTSAAVVDIVAEVAVLDGDGDGGNVELPSGALLVRCSGATATALSARHGTPVIVADRTLDDATATAIAVALSDGCPPGSRDEAVGLLQSADLEVHVVDDAPGLVVTRTVAMFVNLAVDALQQGVASRADIDTALRLGTNYPLGPLEWGERWGFSTVHRILTAMQAAYGDPRYRPSQLLQRMAVVS